MAASSRHRDVISGSGFADATSVVRRNDIAVGCRPWSVCRQGGRLRTIPLQRSPEGMYCSYYSSLVARCRIAFGPLANSVENIDRASGQGQVRPPSVIIVRGGAIRAPAHTRFIGRPANPHLRRQLGDRFSRFSTTHGRDQRTHRQTDRQTTRQRKQRSI